MTFLFTESAGTKPLCLSLKNNSDAYNTLYKSISREILTIIQEIVATKGMSCLMINEDTCPSSKIAFGAVGYLIAACEKLIVDTKKLSLLTTPIILPKGTCIKESYDKEFLTLDIAIPYDSCFALNSLALESQIAKNKTSEKPLYFKCINKRNDDITNTIIKISNFPILPVKTICEGGSIKLDLVEETRYITYYL